LRGPAAVTLAQLHRLQHGWCGRAVELFGRVRGDELCLTLERRTTLTREGPIQRHRGIDDDLLDPPHTVVEETLGAEEARLTRCGFGEGRLDADQAAEGVVCELRRTDLLNQAMGIEQFPQPRRVAHNRHLERVGEALDLEHVFRPVREEDDASPGITVDDLLRRRSASPIQRQKL
jgi:hypothetical protein